MLWGRAAHRCSFADCRKFLEMDDGLVSEPSLIGDVAHIVAEKIKGPRGDSTLSLEERHAYGNLILLCKDHHKLIDDNPEEFTAHRLKQIKNSHEQWVRDSLEGFDKKRQRDEELYASYAEEWAERARVNAWEDWTSSLLYGGTPRISKEMLEELYGLRDWLFKRIWPGRHPDLERAFKEFLKVLHDCLELLSTHLEPGNDGRLWTKKFYKIDEWDEERYNRLFREWDYHVDLVRDLVLELTRAANRVCDQIREHLDAQFGIDSGVLIVESSDLLTYHKMRPEYSRDQHYIGLDEFRTERIHRDRHFGEGHGPNANAEDV